MFYVFQISFSLFVHRCLEIILNTFKQFHSFLEELVSVSVSVIQTILQAKDFNEFDYGIQGFRGGRWYRRR